MSPVRSKRRLAVACDRVEGLEARRLFAYAYTITDLTPGSDHTGIGMAVNNKGQVAMQYDGDAAYYSNGSVTDLGFKGIANDINAYGDVCGTDTSSGGSLAFIEQSGGAKQLIQLPAGALSARAIALNDQDYVVGNYTTNGGAIHGFVWYGSGTAVDFGVPAGADGLELTGINNANQVVGNVRHNNAGVEAFGASAYGGAITRLLHATASSNPLQVYRGLNDDGTIAAFGDSGQKAANGVDTRYDIYTGPAAGPLTDVAPVAGTYDTRALDINAAGRVVGYYYGNNQPTDGLVTSGGQATSLTSAVDPLQQWTISNGEGINDNGQITGSGYHGGANQHAYLMTPTTGTVRGFVFKDSNGDGVQERGEGALADTQISLTGNRITYVRKTGPSGTFTIDGLPAGTYTLHQSVQSGYQLGSGDVASYTVTVAAGKPVEGKLFGQKPIANSGSISGRVWNDTNGDGKFGSGEQPSGVRTVFIDLDGDNTPDANEPQTQSDASGGYKFANLADGTYRVERVLPAGYVLTNGVGGAVTVSVSGGKAVTNVDLGSGKAVAPPANTASVSGTLWDDTDKDGIFDAGEKPSGIRQVYLDANRNGKLDAGETSVNSDANGVYKFTGLSAGTYYVSRVFPSGYKLSNAATTYLTVTVAANQAKTGVNLGSKKA